MAALASFRDTKQVNGLTRSKVDLGAGKVVFAGGIVVTDTSTGYGCAGKTGTGLVARGIAQVSVDNTGGAAGAASVDVDNRPAWLDISGADPVSRANVDQPVFMVDDHTIAATDGGGTRSTCGILREVGVNGALVEFSGTNGTVLAAEIAAREALEANLADQDALAGVLTGKSVANVADANVVGGIEVAHRIDVADGVTADIDVVLTHKTLITQIEVIKKAGAGGADDTITVKNGATAITDAMSLNVADKTIVRPTTIDDAQMTIAAAGTLRVTRTKVAAANVACLVIVRGLRVA